MHYKEVLPHEHLEPGHFLVVRSVPSSGCLDSCLCLPPSCEGTITGDYNPLLYSINTIDSFWSTSVVSPDESSFSLYVVVVACLLRPMRMG